MTEPNVAATLIADGTRGHVPGLRGISGRLNLCVETETYGAIEVEDGEVVFRSKDGEGDAVAICDRVETLVAIGHGELNPVVAALQNRLELQGDRAFAIKVIRELHGTSPFAQKD
jgi:putative sterol carrier protein